MLPDYSLQPLLLDDETLEPDQLNKPDQKRRQAFASVFPAYFPTLRYLLFSRTQEAKPFDGFKLVRLWTCYRVVRSADGAELVEIPLWEGERVMKYCKRASDPEAFDRFDGNPRLRTVRESVC